MTFDKTLASFGGRCRTFGDRRARGTRALPGCPSVPTELPAKSNCLSGRLIETSRAWERKRPACSCVAPNVRPWPAGGCEDDFLRSCPVRKVAPLKIAQLNLLQSNSLFLRACVRLLIPLGRAEGVSHFQVTTASKQCSVHTAAPNSPANRRSAINAAEPW